MNENLSQKEIDSLFGGSGGPAGFELVEEIVPYDFMRPAWFSKERRTIFETVFSRFANALQGYLSPRVRIPLEITLHSVDQAVFAEFTQSLETPCAAFVFSVGDRLGGQGVLALGPDLSCRLLERLLGGVGEAGDTGRPLTPVEQAVLQGVVARALELLRDVARERFLIQPALAAVESDPAMLQIATREDNVLVANLLVQLGEATGNLAVCMPMAVCESGMQAASPRRSFQPAPAEPENGRARAGIAGTLRLAHVSLRARLPMVRINARTLANLREGSVLPTGHLADEPVEIQINDRPAFYASLGQVRRRVSLQITESMRAADLKPTGRDKEGRVL
jgi:flagellar motor switch protein FliM